MKAILKLTVMLLLLAGGLGSCDKDENNPTEIPFTDYSLEGTSCRWTNLGYDEKVIIINSDEELKNYIACEGENYPDIDFSQSTLLLASGYTSGVIQSYATTFLQNPESGYTLKVSLYVGIIDVMVKWQVPIRIQKISNIENVVLKIETIY